MSTNFLITATVFAFGAASLANASIALEPFSYTGTCTDCTFSNGTLLLIAGYTPGSPVNSSNFVSFSYNSNLLSFGISQSSPGFFVSGGLPSTLPGPATLIIGDNQWEFSSSTSGAWSVTNTSLADFGPSNTFSASSSAPEPGTMAMLGLGLLAAIMVRYRRGLGCSIARLPGDRVPQGRS